MDLIRCSSFTKNVFYEFYLKLDNFSDRPLKLQMDVFGDTRRLLLDKN